MPTNTSASYHVYVEDGDKNVGVWHRVIEHDPGQFVRVDVSLVKWQASPPIVPYGDAHLSADNYKYTGILEGEVFASNDPHKSQLWHFIHIAEKDAYYVSVDKVGNYVWTAGGKHQPVKIDKFTGEPNQIFKFIPV